MRPIRPIRPAVRRWVRAARRPTAVDLFCGAGGLSLGLQDAGFTVLVGADSDPLGRDPHGELGGLGYIGDLTDPRTSSSTSRVGESDGRSGRGRPAVPAVLTRRTSEDPQLGREGARSVEDPRAQLWRSFVAVVERLRPRAVLVENVPDLPSWDDGAVLIGLYESLRELGYHVDARILDAFSHGVPQHRARLFMVGRARRRPMRWPEPAHNHAHAAGRDRRPAARARRLSARGAPLRRAPTHRPPAADATGMPRRRSVGVVHDHITRDVRRTTRGLRAARRGPDLRATSRRACSATAATSSPTSTSASPGMSSAARSLRTSPRTATGTSIPNSTGRSRSARRPASRHFPTASGSPASRRTAIGRSETPCRRCSAEAIGRALLSAHLETTGDAAQRGPRRVSRELLLAWHAEHARSFPWRGRGLAPWQVLMAEMCLHRTRADQVRRSSRRSVRIAPDPAGDGGAARGGARGDAIAGTAVARREHHRRRPRRWSMTSTASVPDTELELRTLPGRRRLRRPGGAVLRIRSAGGADGHQHRRGSSGAAPTRRTPRRWQLRLDLYRAGRRPRTGRRVQLRAAGPRRAGLPGRQPAMRACVPLRATARPARVAAPPPQLELDGGERA